MTPVVRMKGCSGDASMVHNNYNNTTAVVCIESNGSSSSEQTDGSSVAAHVHLHTCRAITVFLEQPVQRKKNVSI